MSLKVTIIQYIKTNHLSLSVYVTMWNKFSGCMLVSTCVHTYVPVGMVSPIWLVPVKLSGQDHVLK